MDTRDKIVSMQRAEAMVAEEPRAWVVVTGYFDPVLASHARRLRELARPGKKLMAVVTSPASPILPAAARAELVAGLAMVDAVVPLEDPLDRFPEQLPWEEAIHEEQNDEARLLALVEHVQVRQQVK